jgi:uncharacterized membrane protein YgcG
MIQPGITLVVLVTLAVAPVTTTTIPQTIIIIQSTTITLLQTIIIRRLSSQGGSSRGGSSRGGSSRGGSSRFHPKFRHQIFSSHLKLNENKIRIRYTIYKYKNIKQSKDGI